MITQKLSGTFHGQNHILHLSALNRITCALRALMEVLVSITASLQAFCQKVLMAEIHSDVDARANKNFLRDLHRDIMVVSLFAPDVCGRKERCGNFRDVHDKSSILCLLTPPRC
jgi:hypothetical protein